MCVCVCGGGGVDGGEMGVCGGVGACVCVRGCWFGCVCVSGCVFVGGWVGGVR